jgi:hypothetical protein
MAFNSVAVSVIFIAMRRGSCDGKTWETKRMAISISLDAFLRSSRSLKPASSCCLPPQRFAYSGATGFGKRGLPLTQLEQNR